MSKVSASEGVGLRCCEEVDRLVEDRGTPRIELFRRAGLERKGYNKWKDGGSPSARALERLTAEGADPLYILTGRRSGDTSSGPAAVGCYLGSGRHAFWTLVKEGKDKLLFQCSRCGRRTSIHPVNRGRMEELYPYCHCGAQMKVEKKGDLDG